MNTALLLAARFESPTVRLDAICEEFFGLTPVKANEYASLEQLPVPTFRLRESNKSPRLVHLDDLARWIDSQRGKANAEWEKAQV